MKIAIESPQKMSDRDLEEDIDVWNRKPCRLLCKSSNLHSLSVGGRENASPPPPLKKLRGVNKPIHRGYKPI